MHDDTNRYIDDMFLVLFIHIFLNPQTNNRNENKYRFYQLSTNNFFELIYGYNNYLHHLIYI